MITLSPQGRRLLSLLYVAALVILVDQSLDLMSAVWPIRGGLATWRFGTFGLATARLEFLALADALALVTALYLGHRRLIVVLGVLHLLIGLFLAAGLGLFLLDGLQIRRAMQPERVRELEIAGLRTVMLGGMACLACLAVAVAVWRTRQVEAKSAKPREGFLVTGAPGAPTHE